ncbi:MAG: glycosyltransferase, partial [Bacteroidales bacterium]|nr:glycosyltransferase [Bacteroidales bacterium]
IDVNNFIKDFDEDAYLEANPDVQIGIENGQFKDAKHHLETFGFDEIKLGMRKFHKEFEVFSVNKYMEFFPDIDKAIKDGDFSNGFEHFSLDGYREIIREERSWNLVPNVNPILSEVKNVEISSMVDTDLCELNPDQLHIYNSLSKEEIDWIGYEEGNNLTETIDNPLLHYIHNWKDLLPVLPNIFDTRLYVELYPDIMSNNVNPLYHYMLHGRDEGREGYFNIEDYIDMGKLEYKSNLQTLIVVNHESSATGAPLLGLNIAKTLSDKYNIIQIILKPSNLQSEFLESCGLMISDIRGEVIVKRMMQWIKDNKEVMAVICNSTETYSVLKAASELNFPTISLVHEFANYTRPVGKLSYSVFYADKVIVPANIIKLSLSEELKKTTNIKNELKNLIVLPQGKLPYIPEGYGENLSVTALKKQLNIDDDTKVIVGAGFVHIRKGVDLFIAMVAYIKNRYKGKCKFIWIGGGYDPVDDLNYSVWLEKQIQASGLEENFTFLGHQKNLDNVLAIADVFALTSRLDPFPNVVVDALSSDVHVACFADSTGCAEFLVDNHANCTVVDYLDTNQMANKIIDHWLEKTKIVRDINRNIVQDKLNFDQYINTLKKYIDEIEVTNKANKKIVSTLLEHNEFDNNFFSFKEDEKEGCQFYVNNTQKGINLYNPKPGFSDNNWLNNHAKDDRYVVPLYEALKVGLNTTHQVQIVPYPSDESIDFLYAVHLHLFYSDLAEEFADFFKKLPGKFDILITMVEDEDDDPILEIFSRCGANKVKIVKVDNIGRDIGPLLFDLKDDILMGDYEIIGHFHSKKSLDINNEMGNKWRKYLMENLIGDEEVAKSVLGLFSDPEVGLVFAEDAHTVDIGDNKEYINDLCKMINIQSVEETSIFPLGNMFWARVDAIKELFTLDKAKVLEEEPLP